MKIAKDFAIVVCILSLAICFLFVAHLALVADQTIQLARPSLLASLKDAPALITQYQGLAAASATTLYTLNQAAADQSTYWHGAATETKKTLGDAHDLLKHLDVQLNGTENNRAAGFLPQADTALGTLNEGLGSINALVGNANNTILTLPPLISKGYAIADNVDRLVADPELLKTIDTANAALSQIEGMAVDGHGMTTLAFHQMQEYFKPVSFSMKVYKFLLGHLVDGTEMWYYLYR